MRASRVFTAAAAACAVLLAAGSIAAANLAYLPGDVRLERAIQSLPLGALTHVIDLTNSIAAERETMLAFALAIVIGLLSWRAGLLVLLVIPVTYFEDFLKQVVHRPRPSAALVQIREHDAGFSFPSGHTAFYASLSLLLVVALWPRLPARVRPVAVALACLLVVVAWIGRVWVGAHWPSDALGGMLFGVVWAWLAWLVWRRATRRTAPASVETRAA